MINHPEMTHFLSDRRIPKKLPFTCVLVIDRMPDGYPDLTLICQDTSNLLGAHLTFRHRTLPSVAERDVLSAHAKYLSVIVCYLNLIIVRDCRDMLDHSQGHHRGS
jgi:hypothetical protein